MEVSLQSFKKRFTYDPQKDLLGKGGFGEVYKAYDTEDHIFVALKISQGTADDKYNLINEIKRFKKLNHPNIVKHIEAYEVNTGSSDIHGKPIAYHVGILEYANNGTLADLLKKGTPDYRIIEDLAKDIIDGLAYLHSENIIHRDLKPTNILLFSEGEKLRAKITDFGIAKRTDATAASTQLVGTVEYMAPEFFSTGNITPAADVWSLGVMLLEALTGTHPFGKTTQGLGSEQIINNILNKELSTVTQNLLPPFKEIITRCLLRETNLRPQSAVELKGLLLQGGDTFSEKTQVITRPKNLAKADSISRKKKIIAIFIFLFFALFIGIVGWLISSGKIGFNNKPAESNDYILQNSQPTTLDSGFVEVPIKQGQQQSTVPAPTKSNEIVDETPKDEKGSNNTVSTPKAKGYKKTEIEIEDANKVVELKPIVDIMRKYISCDGYIDIRYRNGEADYIIHEGNYRTVPYRWFYFAEVDIVKIFDEHGIEQQLTKQIRDNFIRGNKAGFTVNVRVWAADANYRGDEDIFNGYFHQDNAILCGLSSNDFSLISKYFQSHYHRAIPFIGNQYSGDSRRFD